MARSTGGAELPLHSGHIPAWLSQRMSLLARVIVEALVLEYGRGEVLRRLSHPFWFQSLGAVMGMDWHSSGITTAVLAALRRGLRPVERELGLYVCGGRGRASRKTPAELRAHAERLGLDGEQLVRISRLVAKVDGAALQDGYQLYLHGFLLADDGSWVVVQQGMCPEQGRARRYHWLSEGLESFLDHPHTGIDGPVRAHAIVNLADERARRARAASVRLAQQGPEACAADLRLARRQAGLQTEGSKPSPSVPRPYLLMPDRHDVQESDVVPRRFQGALAAAQCVENYEELLLTPGVGARTLAALAFVAEILHGAPSRFSDPARFSLALGGKDGHPFPVPVKVYDRTLRVLRQALGRARLGRSEALHALRRLDAQARRLETSVEGPDFEAHVAAERRRSRSWGGRTASPIVPAASVRPRASSQQLPLFAEGSGRRGPWV